MIQVLRSRFLYYRDHDESKESLKQHKQTSTKTERGGGSHQGEGGVEDSDEDICHGQVHDEQAGGGLGAFVFHHYMADQRVSEQGDHDDEGVGGHQQRLHAPVLPLPAAALLTGQRAPVLQHPLVKVQEEKARSAVIQLSRNVK